VIRKYCSTFNGQTLERAAAPLIHNNKCLNAYSPSIHDTHQIKRSKVIDRFTRGDSDSDTMSNHSYDDNAYQQANYISSVNENRSTATSPAAASVASIPTVRTHEVAADANTVTGGRPEIFVHNHDVLSGRGVNIAQHPGNERFRSLITSYTDKAYCTTYSVTEKKAVAIQIIQHIQNLDPPGRFLKREGKGGVSRGLEGPWEELTERDAVKKTCQALRDCNRQDRTGYAEGVAAPSDVKHVVEQVSKAGLSVKERAVAAAAMIGPAAMIGHGFSDSNSSSHSHSYSDLNREQVQVDAVHSSGTKRSRDEVDNDYYANVYPQSVSAHGPSASTATGATNNPAARASPIQSNASARSQSISAASRNHPYYSSSGNPAQPPSQYAPYYPNQGASSHYHPHPSHNQHYNPRAQSHSYGYHPPAQGSSYSAPNAGHYQHNQSQPPITDHSYPSDSMYGYGSQYHSGYGNHPHNHHVDTSNHHDVDASNQNYQAVEEPWSLKKQRTEDTDPSTGVSTSASSPSTNLDSSLEFGTSAHAPSAPAPGSDPVDAYFGKEPDWTRGPIEPDNMGVDDPIEGLFSFDNVKY